jgi:hypothetical protein
MLLGGRTEVFIPWKRIRKVKFLDKQKCIFTVASLKISPYFVQMKIITRLD